ncbi:AAA family ATPase [Pseudomonas syringae]|uniref:AAA family ATPase n=1 Tax=Pseudomonas syringae TaxID=317 RepID=UPI001EEE3E80|nr:AAA family ATPase [Pseudomonas syringae]
MQTWIFGGKMIYVDRSRVPMPFELSPLSIGGAELLEAKAYFLHRKDRQGRFKFQALGLPPVRNALRDLFFNKCAYCESHLSIVAGDVETYRPKGAVSESALHRGYWWLAVDWANLLIACPDCNRPRRHTDDDDNRAVSGKGNRFPLLDESARCLGPQDDLSREKPLLLNPCVDDPDEHLIFDWGGLVASDTLRGQTTIAVLGLNRRGLVEARAREAKLFRLLLEQASRGVKNIPAAGIASTKEFEEELRSIKYGMAQYAGMKRQLLRMAQHDLKFFGDSDKAAISNARLNRARKSLQKFELSQSSYTLSNEAGRKIARSQKRLVEYVSLRNFKGLRDIEISVVSKGGGAGWLMLLGENSTGKSSVLQAIALCLTGADYFATLVTDGRILPKDLINSRARRSVVTVKLSGFIAPHRMTISDSGATFENPSEKSASVTVFSDGKVKVVGDKEARNGQLVLLGYGATRLLPFKRPQQYGLDFARIDNLFDPFLPLFDADKWLSNLEQIPFDRVALILKDLMSLDDSARLHRKQTKVYVRSHGDNAPIKRLSDGFQSVVAMTVDILEVAMRLWGNSETAEGIVLLDEIGAHLHPSWKMQIVSSLRRAFPGMQFIATTHDPLCLRGLTEGEVVVMNRNKEGRIVPITDLPSPADFRVDQLLTSEFFGLNSTVDPETEILFDRYYALLAMRDRTLEQQGELEQLQQVLRDRRYVGDTLREQLMFEAIDKVVAEHLVTGSFSMPEMKLEAAKELADMWDSAVSSLEGKR